MFIAALVTIAKTWKQPKCPLTNEWVVKMDKRKIYIILCNHQKEGNPAICDNMDER